MNVLSSRRRLTGSAVVLLLTLGIVTSGCKDAFHKDVTNDPKYGDFFRVVGKWKARVPLELAEIDKKPYLAPKSDRYPTRGRAILSLPIGTEIRIEHLIYHGEVMGGSPLYMMGSPVSGPYAGQSIRLDDQFFRQNRFTRPELSKTPPPDWTLKWTVSSDILAKS
jgi:hypothetical protein